MDGCFSEYHENLREISSTTLANTRKNFKYYFLVSPCQDWGGHHCHGDWGRADEHRAQVLYLLYCAVLFYTVLYCTVLYWWALCIGPWKRSRPGWRVTTPSCRGGASEDIFTIYIQQHIIIIIMCSEIRRQYYFTLNNKLFKLIRSRLFQMLQLHWSWQWKTSSTL